MDKLIDPSTYLKVADDFATFMLYHPNRIILDSEELLNLADTLMHEGHFRHATTIYQVHTLQFTKSVEGWVGQARINCITGETTKALTLYQEALLINPYDPMIRHEFDRLLSELCKTGDIYV